jgi:drug/metabolite transporter (DMT)-like permease
MASTRRSNWRKGIVIAAICVALLAIGIAAAALLSGDVRVWQLIALIATVTGVIFLLFADLTAHWRRDPDVEAALPPQGQRSRIREERADLDRDGSLRSIGHSLLLFGAAAVLGLYLRG